MLGFQSIAQVRGTYGDPEAQTIVENCGNTLILRCFATEHGGTAEFASRLIGKREVIWKQLSHSRPTRLGGSIHEVRTTSEQRFTEDAVMASEIEQLPDLSGFLKLASEPHSPALAARYVATLGTVIPSSPSGGFPAALRIKRGRAKIAGKVGGHRVSLSTAGLVVGAFVERQRTKSVWRYRRVSQRSHTGERGRESSAPQSEMDAGMDTPGGP